MEGKVGERAEWGRFSPCSCVDRCSIPRFLGLESNRPSLGVETPSFFVKGSVVLVIYDFCFMQVLALKHKTKNLGAEIECFFLSPYFLSFFITKNYEECQKLSE